jgi:lipopolysaccharide/colanic/teichoic acid biosynthesis glycosyltransferase
VLKLCSLITWGWWLVFSPILIGVGLYLLAFIIAIAIVFIKKIKKGDGLFDEKRVY